MKISKLKVKQVADLAKLNFSEQEIEKITKEMESLVSYVDKLNELNTSGITPREHILPIKNVFREDVTKKSFMRKKILENAPSSEKGCFRVPKTVE